MPKVAPCARRVPAFRLAAIFLCLALSALAATAQEFRGTISGIVSDPRGAIVPNAQVIATENSTGTATHTTSDKDGQYVIPFLLPGTYTITVTAPGFRDTKQTGISLEAQGHPVVSLTLQVGSATDTVVVTAAPPQLNLANGAVGQVISTESVATLPLNGRTPTTLTELAAGVITTAAPEMVRPFDNNAGNAWSMGGTPNQVSEVLLDGSPDLTLLGALAYAPTQDSVSEVSIRPFDTDASFGHTIGGVINQVTKSGTNAFHGTAYEFGQISGIDANTYFNDRNSIATPVFHFNQYGLTFGGPVIIPKAYNGKDKLFFFFAWEGLKDSTPTTTTTTVPTAAEKAGDFSETLTGGCNGGTYTVNASNVAVCDSTGANDANQLYNPFTASTSGSNVTRAPIANNQLTSAVSSFNPIALNYLNFYPSPNAKSGVGVNGENNYISEAPATDTYNNEFGRLDYNLNARDHIFFDFRHNYRTEIEENYFGNDSTGETLVRENHGATLDNVFTLNPTTFIDTRVNWVHFNEVHGSQAQKYTPESVGFPGYMNTASKLLQLPYINFNTGGSCGSFTSYQCFGDTSSALDPTTSYQFFTDMVKTIGNHSLKIGFDGRRYLMSVQSFGDSSGSFTFASNFVTSGTTGATQTFGGDMASFMFGLPTAGEYDLEARGDYYQYYIGTFVQDDWHINNRLTLNLGLRFDIDTPFREKQSRTVNGFNPTAAINYTSTPDFSGASETVDGETFTVSSINTLGGLTYPTSATDGAVYKNNSGFFSPRFGFSFAADNKTVVRGGFGIFVQPETLATLAATGTYSSTPLSNQEGFSASTSYVASTNNYLTYANTLSNPFPSGFNQPAGKSLGANTFLGQTISFLAPYEHDPYSERWNFDIQRSVTPTTMVEAIYVGNHSLHLPVASHNLNAMEAQYLSYTPYRNQALSSAYGKSVTNPFYGTLGSTNTTTLNDSKTTAFGDLLYPYPQFYDDSVTEENMTIGSSNFEDAILHIEQRASHGLTLTANYSFSKMIEADTFLNDEDAHLTRRISPFDHTHHFTVGGTYELPFGRDKQFNFGGSRLWDLVAGGFVINSIYQFQSGAPIEFSADIPLAPGYTLRDIHANGRNTSPVGSGNPALNTKAFVTGNSTSCPTTGSCNGSGYLDGQYVDHYRTLPQTMSWVRQDGYNNLDASILKNFNFTRTTYFQLRFETFNTLNHPVFSAPYVASATSSEFGYVTAVASSSKPRQIQIGGRIVF
ncbi:carboxypeptidase regulatory-like domain-containing protein [Silvibacterium sp.]|uniref:carboxypeptidase regulatory-like domain-containing protein n=1 Tax=Silvibacterium sp. TaxID=1964179 RepID=UPI0039E577EB